ncbi:MAG: hypothetical protein ACYS9T_04995 [Planctomycetota bacterium]|jgi:hypothetical protein
MKRREFVISVVAFLGACVPGTSGLAAVKARTIPLHDGFVLAGVTGRLTVRDTNEALEGGLDRWFFEFADDVADGKGRVKAGASLELLPSATLERMTADAKKGSGADCRLWARVTRYRGKNYIFPIFPTHFLPVSETGGGRPTVSEKPASQESGGAATASDREQKGEPAVNEPNDVLAIPEEIMTKLQAGRVARPSRLVMGAESAQDPILSDRIGLVRSAEYGMAHIEYAFVFDAFGRKPGQVSLRLLPCEALQGAEQRQSAEADPPRFKIAGIVTKYRGDYYLLLHKATRVYSHENFGI